MGDRCPSAGGLLPLGTAIGAGRENRASTPFHHFSSRDAPPLPSPHIRGNPLQWGATPGQRMALCEHTGNQVMPLPGGLLPPGPPANTIGAGTGKPRRHVHPLFFIERCSAPPVPAYSGQSYAGGRGCNPRAEDGVVWAYGKSGYASAGGLAAPPVPPQIR